MNFDILPLLLIITGGYFLIKLKFFFVLHPIRTAARGIRAIKDGRAVRSFLLALAGTLGVGNVFGVALGILVGGAGSLFWLLVSMTFAMVIKYCEVTLASDNLCHDTDTHGGFYYVIRNSFSRLGGVLSAVYALAALLISLVMGAALQSDAVAQTLSEISDFPREMLGIILIALTLVAIVGGARKIEKITAIIIPLSTIIYIFLTLGVILVNVYELPRVLCEIVSSAFSPRGALGGALAFLLSAPLREGFRRGLLSNEAGAGTSAMAHARGGVLSPASAGILGILEVWFDTGLICMLTGLSILLAVPDTSPFVGGMQLVTYSVGNLFGEWGKIALLATVLCFAFATLICWYYYGSECWCALFGRRRRTLFLLFFLAAVFFGCFADSYVLVALTDLLMLVATVLTLLALVKNSDRVIALSESGGIIELDVGRLRPGRIKGSVFSKAEQRRRHRASLRSRSRSRSR